MPSTYVDTDHYQMIRIWERNGPGPKVPHPFRFVQGRVTSTNWPASGGSPLLSGGAYTNLAPVTTDMQYRLYNKIRDEMYASAQLGADIGEARQTLDMLRGALTAVRSPLKTVGTFMRRYARLKGRNIALVPLKDVAGAHLEFTYGVKPLIQSISDLCSILQRPYPLHVVRASTRSTWADASASNPAYTEVLAYNSQIRAEVTVQLENPALFGAAQLGLTNPAAILWELVPFSFVVDWFTPIGPWLSSWSDFSGVAVRSGFQTQFGRTIGYRSWPLQDPVVWIADESVICKRTLDVPSFPAQILLKMKTAQSRQHIINALSLITNIGANALKK